jgi:hypothetical protein
MKARKSTSRSTRTSELVRASGDAQRTRRQTRAKTWCVNNLTPLSCVVPSISALVPHAATYLRPTPVSPTQRMHGLVTSHAHRARPPALPACTATSLDLALCTGEFAPRARRRLQHHGQGQVTVSRELTVLPRSPQHCRCTRQAQGVAPARPRDGRQHGFWRWQPHRRSHLHCAQDCAGH